jgi:hypothetical protein
MLPFSLQRLILELRNGTKNINVVQSKLKFCNEFEIELKIQSSRYAEDVYDFWYNIARLSKQIKNFDTLYKTVKSWDYKDVHGTSEEINKTYQVILSDNIELFYDIFGLTNSDPYYVTAMMEAKKKTIHSTLLTNLKAWGHI